MDEIQNIEMYTDRQCHRKRVISAVKKVRRWPQLSCMHICHALSLAGPCFICLFWNVYSSQIEPQSTPLFSPVLGKSLLLGSEEWDVKACTQTRKYRVDYYSGMGGDFLYSAVTPSSYQQYAPYLYYRFNSFASKLKKHLTSSSDE